MSTLGEDFLTGTLDRVYRDADGRWNVLDYKTDAISKINLKQKIDQYTPQVKFYALLVQKFFSAENVRAKLLFTAVLENPISLEFSRDEMLKFEAELASIIAKIRATKFATDGLPCSGCPFAPEGCSIHLK